MRTNKKTITIDIESATALMQEIYNDTVEQKATATLIMKKMLNFMKESEDMSVIGPVIKEQQKIINECTEKKLSLVKIQNSLIQKASTINNNSVSGGKISFSAEDLEILDKFIKKDEPTTQKYKI